MLTCGCPPLTSCWRQPGLSSLTHHYKYYLQLDGSQAFWSIPLTEESKKLLAFWDRLTMGAQPSSSVQQGAYHETLDTHIPWQYRHRFALMADDIAAGAGSLEELFEESFDLGYVGRNTHLPDGL